MEVRDRQGKSDLMGNPGIRPGIGKSWDVVTRVAVGMAAGCSSGTGQGISDDGVSDADRAMCT